MGRRRKQPPGEDDETRPVVSLHDPTEADRAMPVQGCVPLTLTWRSHPSGSPLSCNRQGEDPQPAPVIATASHQPNGSEVSLLEAPTKLTPFAT